LPIRDDRLLKSGVNEAELVTKSCIDLTLWLLITSQVENAGPGTAVDSSGTRVSLEIAHLVHVRPDTESMEARTNIVVHSVIMVCNDGEVLMDCMVVTYRHCVNVQKR